MNPLQSRLLNEIYNDKVVIIDGDGLLSNEQIFNAIKQKGYDILKFEDPISFRFEYELKHRSLLNEGDGHKLAIITNRNPTQIPYDLYCGAQIVNCDLHRLLPNFDYDVVKSVPMDFLNELLELHEGNKNYKLNSQETIDLILEFIFKFNFTIHGATNEFTKWMLSELLFTKKVGLFGLPPLFIDRITSQLSPTLNKMPIRAILSDRGKLIEFFQEEWNKYVNGILDRSINFEDDDIRVYIRDLFAEGRLKPVTQTNPIELPSWTAIGIQGPTSNVMARLDLLMQSIERDISVPDMHSDDWLLVSHKLAEARVLIINHDVRNVEIESIISKCQKCFESWLIDNYGSLFSLPYLPRPKIANQIAQFIRNESKKTRCALIVLDGMSIDDWLIIREKMSASQSNLTFSETELFALVPTTTSISRKAIFSGSIPAFLTNPDVSEDSLWKKFWQSNADSKRDIASLFRINDTIPSDLYDAIADENNHIIGIVIVKIDDIIHGICVGMKGVYESLKIWMDESLLMKIINSLLNAGFRIFITSDHGNTESKGIGLLSQGALVDYQCKRAMIFDRVTLRDHLLQAHDFIKWPSEMGLPPDKLVLMPHYGESFDKPDKYSISHGGISIEEVIVPFIEIGRKAP